MAAVRDQEDADELLDEIVDRYGDPPKGVLNLIDIALLRAKAAKAGITEISQKQAGILFTLHNFCLLYTSINGAFPIPTATACLPSLPARSWPAGSRSSISTTFSSWSVPAWRFGTIPIVMWTPTSL